MNLIAATDRSHFVDLDVSVGAWLALLAVIVAMLAIDLYRHREAHAPTPKEAATESIIWVMCGLAFSGVIAVTFGGAAFGEYISGYLIEKSLSVDNVFVWSMLFATLAIPLKYQHRVLFWGIFGALTLRAIFIVVGQRPDQPVLVAAARVRRLPRLHRVQDHPPPRRRGGQRVDTRARPAPASHAGDRRARRPEVLHEDQRHARGDAAVRRAGRDRDHRRDLRRRLGAGRSWRCRNEPFIVFASNAFAILGLRAMYFLLANAKETLPLPVARARRRS